MIRFWQKITIFLGVLFLVSAGSPVFAAESPSTELQQTVEKILSVLKNPAYPDPAKRPPLRAEIEKLVHHIFDFSEFSARTVGRNWSSFSPEQKKQFDEAFAELLLTTYLDKIQGYNGERIAYTGQILSQKGDRAEVKTIVTLSDGKKVPVDYRMMLKNNRWVVYDVIIENVSLIKNYRSQFQDVLNKGSAEKLINRVKIRAQELRAAENK